MRILGIDLGSSSVKAVELDSSFGRYEIHDYYESKIAPGAGPAQALSMLMQTLPKTPDKVIVALPTRHMTFRNLKLPTRDRKAIQSSVGFELEDELPFTTEQSIFDYTQLNQSKAGTEVHVAATIKKHVSDMIQTLQSAGVDPDVITSESWAYRVLVNRVVAKEDQAAPILLARIGNERTTLYVHWNGTPILCREIAWGGRDLTAAIAAKYRLTPEQADAAKLDHGFVIPDTQRGEVTPEQQQFSETLMVPIRDLLSQIRQVDLTTRNLTHKSLARVYLAGGTTLLPGFLRVIEESIFIPVRGLQALSSVATSGITYSEQTDAAFALAAAVSLCLVGQDRSSQINFRKGVFAKGGPSRSIDFAAVKKPLLAGGLITASLTLSMAIEAYMYRSKLKEVDVQLERNLKSFFTAISSSGIRTYLMSPSKMKTDITNELNSQRTLAKIVGPNPRSPTEYLKMLSTTIPRDVVVDMMQFQVGASADSYAPNADQPLSLSFVFSEPQTADRLSTLLASKIKGFSKGKTEAFSMPDGTQRWKVTLTGRATEDSYGK